MNRRSSLVLAALVLAAPRTLFAQPPAPSIATPTDGEHLGSATPTYRALSIAAGTVTFVVDGVVLGDGTPNGGLGTYDLVQSTALAQGLHTVSATVTNGSGTSPSSPTVTFLVDLTAPSNPHVDTPTEGSISGDRRPNVLGSAEPGSSVQVYIDGFLAGPVVVANAGGFVFEPPADYGSGTHSVRVRCFDRAGNFSGYSTTVNFTIDADAPGAPTIEAPLSGTRTIDTTPTVSGSAEAGVLVRIYRDGTLWGSVQADGGGAFEFTPTVALDDASYAITARAEDEHQNLGIASATVILVVDAVPPAIPVLVAPADGASTNDTTPTLSGTAEPGLTITLLVDGSPAGTSVATAEGTFSVTVTAALVAGVHAVAVRGTDALGRTTNASAVRGLDIDLTPPAAPTPNGPVDGATLGTATPTFSGTTEFGALVFLVLDGGAPVALDAGETGTFTWTPGAPLADGTHEYTLAAVDAAGNAGAVSSEYDFVVDTVVPAAPVVTTPSSTTARLEGFALLGTAEPGATVVLTVDAVEFGTTVADESGAFGFAPPLVLGDVTLSLVARDATGNVSPATVFGLRIVACIQAEDCGAGSCDLATGSCVEESDAGMTDADAGTDDAGSEPVDAGGGDAGGDDPSSGGCSCSAAGGRGAPQGREGLGVVGFVVLALTALARRARR